MKDTEDLVTEDAPQDAPRHRPLRPWTTRWKFRLLRFLPILIIGAVGAAGVAILTDPVKEFFAPAAKAAPDDLPKIPTPTVVCINKSPQRCIVTIPEAYVEDLTVRFYWVCRRPKVRYDPTIATGFAGFEKVILPAGTILQERQLKQFEERNLKPCTTLTTYWPQDQHYRIYPHKLYSVGIKIQNRYLPPLPFPSVKCGDLSCTVSIDAPYPKDLSVMYFADITCPDNRFGRWNHASAPNFTSIPAGMTSVTTSIWSLGIPTMDCHVKPGWTTNNSCMDRVCPPIPNAHVWVPELYHHGGCNFFERKIARANLRP